MSLEDILSLGMRDVARNTRNISDRFSQPKLETAGTSIQISTSIDKESLASSRAARSLLTNEKISNDSQSDIEMRIASLLESYDEQMQISTVSTTDALTHR